MNRVAVIVPYFGAFPTVFPLWWDSCLKNPEIDFFLYTDDERLHTRGNIRVIHTTLPKLKRQFEGILGFPISLEYPQKLCDYKPAYGELFENILSGYEWWGYCDCDILLGNLTPFLQKVSTCSCDVLGGRGSFSLYRNSEKLRRLYARPINGVQRYREVFLEEGICVFDEWWRGPGIFTLFDDAGLEICGIPLADIKMMNQRSGLHFPFLVHDEEMDPPQQRQELASLICRQGGRLYCSTLFEDGTTDKKEILYAHFQNRKILLKHADDDQYGVLPNHTFDLDGNSSPEAILKCWYRGLPQNQEYLRSRTQYEKWRSEREYMCQSRLIPRFQALAVASKADRWEFLCGSKYPCCQSLKGDMVCSQLVFFDDTATETRKQQLLQMEKYARMGMRVPTVLEQTVSGAGHVLEVLIRIDAWPLSKVLLKAQPAQRRRLLDGFQACTDALASLPGGRFQRDMLLREWKRLQEGDSERLGGSPLGWEQIFVDEEDNILFFAWEKNDH